MDAEIFYSLGGAFVIIGALIVLVAILLLSFSGSRKNRTTKGGAVIIVGLFPIVLGADKESVKTLLILSITLVTLLILAMVIFYLLPK